MTHITITIISDTACPHCYLGRARLERAISLYKKTVPGGSASTFSFHWHAYQLDRGASAESVLVTEVAAQRYGADRLTSKRERMAQMGATAGFNFTFGGRIGNTRDSHRVIQLARTKGADVEDQVAMAVMRVFFEEDGDITAWDDLARAAEECGIPSEETMSWLQDGKGGEVVDKEVEYAYQRGYRGVPTYIINDEYVVDGAADVSDFLEQLVMAKEGGVAGPSSVQGANQCADGECVV